jgi:hypothetical protein
MKGFITPAVIIAVGILMLTAVGGGFYVGQDNPEQPHKEYIASPNLGAFSDGFTSLQLSTTTPTADYILKTNGKDNIWIENTGGAGGGLHKDGGGFVYPQTGDYHSAPHYVATSTTATSTFAGDVSFDGDTGLFWSQGTKRLSIGDKESSFVINGATGLGSKITTHVAGVTDIFDITSHSHNDTALFGTAVGLFRSRGTEASPTIVQDDDTLSRIISYGYDGTDEATIRRYRHARTYGVCNNTRRFRDSF